MPAPHCPCSLWALVKLPLQLQISLPPTLLSVSVICILISLVSFSQVLAISLDLSPSSSSSSSLSLSLPMSTIYMSQLSTLPLMEGDQDQGLFPAFHIAKDPPILFPFMINSPVDPHQGQSYGDQHLRQQVFAESNQQFNDHMMMGGTSDLVFNTPSPFRPTIHSIGIDMIQRSTYDPYDIENKRADGSTSRWAVAPPAKMKIMRKATNEYPEGGAARRPRRRAQAHQDESQQQQQGIARVCSDCNTTKTPLWRSGPCGPKSLCNACGIRQRKARRAMAATVAAAASNGGAAVTVSVSQQRKQAKNEKRTEVDQSLPFKKRCKMVTVDQAATAAKVAPAIAGPTKDQDHAVTGDSSAEAASLQSKGSPPPADEVTDAAMLLMTLSCGLVRS